MGRLHAVDAADWPQWLGPHRDSVWQEDGLLDAFPADGPRVLWRQPIGGGFAGPAVADGRVFVMDYQTAEPPVPSASRRDKLSGTERVLCFSATDGKPLWKQEYDRPYHHLVCDRAAHHADRRWRSRVRVGRGR